MPSSEILKADDDDDDVYLEFLVTCSFYRQNKMFFKDKFICAS